MKRGFRSIGNERHANRTVAQYKRSNKVGADHEGVAGNEKLIDDCMGSRYSMDEWM